MNGWCAAVKVLINALCFIMGYLGCHGNTCYVNVIGAIFYMLYSICPINVCTDFEINRYKIDEVRTYAKSRFIWFIWRHVTQNVTSCFMGITTLLIDILTRNILKPTRSLYDFRFKSYGSNSGFRVFGDIDLDLWPIFYCLSHALRTMYWNIHAKFH